MELKQHQNWKALLIAMMLLTLAISPVFSETTNSNTGEIFKFKFEINKPIVYSVQRKSKMITDSSSNGRSSLTRNSSDVRYKIKLTGINTNNDGTITVLYEPFDLEEDIENVNHAGEFQTTVRGLDIVMKQNGIVTVDASKNIGIAQAKNIKFSVYPSLLSGYLFFSRDGVVKKIDGDLPFIDHWQENLKYVVGLFNIVFPTNAIPVHNSWTSCLSLKNFGLYELDRDVIQTNVFSREPDTDNGSIATFTLYENDFNPNLTAYLDQYGQRTSVALVDCNQSKNATFQFDQKAGKLVSMKETERLENTVNVMVQGTSTTSHNTIEVENSMTLVSP